MNKGGTQQIGDSRVTMTHAMHVNSIEDSGRIHTGEPAGLIVAMPGDITIYHAGDLFGDMKLIAELFQPQLAMLPIGDLFTMGPGKAAYAIRFLNIKHVIPMHYATFPALTGTPERLQQECSDVPGLTIHAPQPNESL